MEKLLVAHPRNVDTDQAAAGNVGAEHRLRISIRLVLNNPTLPENTVDYRYPATPHSIIAQGLAFEAAALHTVPC